MKLDYELNIVIHPSKRAEIKDYIDSIPERHKDIQWMYTVTRLMKDKHIFQDLLKQFKVRPNGISLQILDPNKIVPPHIDEKNDSLETFTRISCVSWAIFPDYEDFAPTIYYDKTGNVIYEHRYTEKAFIMQPTKIIHGVINNSNKRYLLQFNFGMTPEDLLERLK